MVVQTELLFLYSLELNQSEQKWIFINQIQKLNAIYIAMAVYVESTRARHIISVIGIIGKYRYRYISSDNIYIVIFNSYLDIQQNKEK